MKFSIVATVATASFVAAVPTKVERAEDNSAKRGTYDSFTSGTELIADVWCHDGQYRDLLWGPQGRGSNTGLDFYAIMQSIHHGGNNGHAGNGYVSPASVTSSYYKSSKNHGIVHPAPGTMYPWTRGSREAFELYEDGYDILSYKFCDMAINHPTCFPQYFSLISEEEVNVWLDSWSACGSNWPGIDEKSVKMTNSKATLIRNLLKEWHQGTFNDKNAKFTGFEFYSQCQEIIR